MNASDFWQSIKSIAEDTSRKYTPFRAKAANVTNGLTQIQTYDSDTPLGEQYPKLRGPKINTDDEVAVIPYGGSNLIMGAVGDGPVEFDQKVLIKPNVSGTGSLVVQDTDGKARFIVDGSTGNGMIGGHFSVGGNLSNRGTGLQPVQVHAFSTDSSLVPSTTATSVYHTVYSYDIPMDNGTWHIQGFGGCQVRHLTNTNASCYVQINNSYRTINRLGGTVWTSVNSSIRGNTVITDGSFKVEVKIMTAQTGGIESYSPWFNIAARRTG